MNNKIGVIICVSLMLYACATVPLTGRRQMKLLPESELVAMSLTSYSTFLDSSNVVSAGSSKQMVTNAGVRISHAVETYLSTTSDSTEIKNYQWEFNLVNDPTVNAWCMPGGKVVFYSGIIPICQSETGVAVVMGHEIAHAIARHGNERMSHGLIQQLGGVALNVAIMDKPEETQQLFQLAYGAGTQLGVMLPFSRKHESEADHMGIMFMAMAGYNPVEAPLFWDRMNAMAGGARPPEFLSTHPNPSKRSADLEKDMPEALKYYKAWKDAQN
ncbi:MAG: putative Zn-dependent protease [Bacteroidia bacterium]|jgi:predicted Zn-dependent protease